MAVLVIVLTEGHNDTPYFVGSLEDAYDEMDSLDSYGVSYTYYVAFAA